MDECSLCSDGLYNLQYDVAVAVLNGGNGNILGSKTNSLVSMASKQSLNQQMTDCFEYEHECHLLVCSSTHIYPLQGLSGLY